MNFGMGVDSRSCAGSTLTVESERLLPSGMDGGGDDSESFNPVPGESVSNGGPSLLLSRVAEDCPVCRGVASCVVEGPATGVSSDFPNNGRESDPVTMGPGGAFSGVGLVSTRFVSSSPLRSSMFPKSDPRAKGPLVCSGLSSSMAAVASGENPEPTTKPSVLRPKLLTEPFCLWANPIEGDSWGDSNTGCPAFAKGYSAFDLAK